MAEIGIKSAENRDDYLYLANLAEQAERFEDMALIMKKFIKLDWELTLEERSLFSVAYKSIIGPLRSSCRAILSMEKKDDSDEKLQMINEYRDKIAGEIGDVCDDVLDLLDILIAKITDSDFESKVFYFKMKADYYRYFAEVVSGDKRDLVVKKSQQLYQEVFDIARDNMAPSHYTRLGLALNFSVFYYEILNDHEGACKLAKEAFDSAMADLDASKNEKIGDKDSMVILQLLRDNLSMWQSEIESDEQDEVIENESKQIEIDAN